MNLYEILGVARNATRDAIKRAYRSKAAQSHPDRGGSPEAFVALQLAYKTLWEEGSRAQYDATGKVEEPGPSPEQQLRAQVLGFISHHLNAMLADENYDLEHEDVRERLEAIAQNQLEAVKANIAGLTLLEERVAKALKRWKKKSEGGNLLAGVTQDFLEGVRNKLKSMHDADKLFLAVIELLGDYEFDFDELPEPPVHPGHMTLHIRARPGGTFIIG